MAEGWGTGILGKVSRGGSVTEEEDRRQPPPVVVLLIGELPRRVAGMRDFLSKRTVWCGVVMLAMLAGPVLAQEDGPSGGAAGMDWGWVHELVMGLLAAGMVVALVYFLRPAKVGGGLADFRILVEGGEIQFKGRFPANMQMLVTQFLLEDCQIPGKYEVRGTWEEGRLMVAVMGEQAKMQEQRIRNFLKLHVKRAG
ncbi:MAG TPA: hypothetical protein VM008_01095 [Phycisphaerae bacterium]|nr:hypothetical protein [Phycisphaerae bacterium]